jgi:hypothetical protein
MNQVLSIVSSGDNRIGACYWSNKLTGNKLRRAQRLPASNDIDLPMTNVRALHIELQPVNYYKGNTSAKREDTPVPFLPYIR